MMKVVEVIDPCSCTHCVLRPTVLGSATLLGFLLGPPGTVMG